METFLDVLNEHRDMMGRMADCQQQIEDAAQILVQTLKQGGKILLCGNGGSAADCQHIAAELVVRYEKKRKALAALALTTDSSILTAHANDIDFQTVFSRQIEALGNAKDCLIAISTSGKSPNILAAVETAKAMGMAVIVLTGGDGGEISALVPHSIIVPSDRTARIQEAHILIGHYWCGAIEEAFSAGDYT